MALNVWVEQSWNDERIRWVPEEYGNISKLTVGANYVWRPDIGEINFMEENENENSSPKVLILK